MPDQERIQVLTRIGRESIIKAGTYDMSAVRKIDSDHIHENDEEQAESGAEFNDGAESGAESDAVAAAGFGDNDSDSNAEAMAEAILRSNFRAGISQSEVDDILKNL